MDDPVWQAFAQTGDPLFYLLYKRQSGGTEDNAPRGED